MLNDMTIRLATEADSEAILKIYAPYITDTVITFEYRVPTSAEFKERMAGIQRNYPWLVCEINDTVAGYAYASLFGEREAFKWSADLSVYIHPEFHRKDIGKALYFALTELLKLQGYYNVFAAVTQNNRGSERFHEALGFQSAGIFHNAGFKFDKWLSVQWYELKIQEHGPSPAEPKPINEIPAKEVKAIFKKAEQMIKTDYYAADLIY